MAARLLEGRADRVRRRRHPAAGRHARAAQLTRRTSPSCSRAAPSARSSCRASCRRPPTSSAARAAPTWCCRSPTCCCCCSAATSTSASWAARRSTASATSTRSFIGDADNPKIRLPGTGGGNDISSLTDMIVAMKHEKRRFVAEGRLHHLARAGSRAGDTRAERGLPQGGMWRVVTDLAVMGFDEETREMKVLALQPGVTPRAGAGQHRLRAAASTSRSRRTEPPRADELAVLRELDPERLVHRPERASDQHAEQREMDPRQRGTDRSRSTDGQEEADRVRHRHAQLHQATRRCRARRA